MNKFFEEIIVINLERSPNRKEMMEKQLSKLSIPYRFFPAFDGSQITNPTLKTLTRAPMKAFSFGESKRARYSVGALCCALSHMSAIKYAQMLDLKGILVFEDDVILSEDFEQRLKFLDEVPEDAQVIYLGAIAYDQKLSKKYQISEHVWNVKKMGFYGMHSYIITRAGYKAVLDKLMECEDTCDALLPQAIEQDIIKGYGVFPFSVYQTGGTSDIDGKKKTLNYTKTLYSPNENFDNMCGYDKKTKTNPKDVTSEYTYESQKTKSLF